jgi:uncharacterized protein involved in outer membrane biogenesis
MEIYGGSATVEAAIKPLPTTTEIELTLNGENLNSREVFDDFFGFAVASGTADLAATLTANGNSRPEFLSTLNGKTRFSIKNGAVSQLDILRTFADASEATSEGWKDGTTPFTELRGSFRITDGIAETNDLSLWSKELSIAATGETDLLREAIEFKVSHESSTAAAPASLPVPVVIAGPWKKPKIYPDMPGILENPEAAYKALRQIAVPVPPPAD